MDLNFTVEEEEFREEVREWIGENVPKVFKLGRGRNTRADRDLWYGRLAEKGWLCHSWPEDAGGPGWSLAKQFIFKDEASKSGAPHGDMGVTMIGPLLIQYGTPEQKERYLPKITAAEEMWCQGYSEPNAGSDLANLALRAVRDGDHYVLDGQKTWTSSASESDMIFILTRTDSTLDKKQNGITFMVASMDTPGIETRPIRQLTDEEHFCETFFTEARVPVENVIGKVDQGWTLAKQLLMHERVSIGSADGYRDTLDKVATLARTVELNGKPAIENDHIRQRLAKLYIDLDALRAIGLRGLTQALRGSPPGTESSINKLYGSEILQATTDLAQEIQGPVAKLWGEDAMGDTENPWSKSAAGSRAFTIFSGTSEIQRNIISERVLGMPRG
ncbi:MAG TPA: pimeloyl-CoA dehydrogenase large subunit [Candidatus Hydrogenedentes bacterium]|nr:pimeloyl-CoA dehydrogenase large subunit [Candidatus Hydrogenedentota bacterium]